MAFPLTHPGFQIEVELGALPLSAPRAAAQLAIPQNRLTEIIRGRRGITASAAVRLAIWLNTTPEFWMNPQRDDELALVAQERSDDIRHQVIAYASPG